MNSNPYQSPTAAYGSIAAHADADQRATFLQRTYLHLLGAILAFAAIDAVILNLFDDQLAPIVGKVSSGWNWLFVLGAFSFVSYFADRWARSDTSRTTQYFGLGLYVLAQALLFIPLLYVAEKFAPDSIASAGVVTAFVFGGLSLVVFMTRADFSMLRSVIVVGTLIAFGLIIASIVVGFTLGIWFSFAMVLLACGSILYSTSNVLHHYRTDQYVAAALSLFASIALLFWYVLQIFIHFDE